jgi:hypothetical protein
MSSFQSGIPPAETMITDFDDFTLVEENVTMSLPSRGKMKKFVPSKWNLMVLKEGSFSLPGFSYYS